MAVFGSLGPAYSGRVVVGGLTYPLLSRCGPSGQLPSPVTAAGTGGIGGDVNTHAFRYYRLTVSATQASNPGWQATELELAEGPGGPDVTLGKTATASTTFGALVPSQLIDDNGTTPYASDFTSGLPQWWKIDLGVGNSKVINELRLRAYNGGSQTDMARSFVLAGSDDDAVWYDLITITLDPFWNADETRTYWATASGPSGTTAYSLTADVGTFTYTGQAASLPTGTVMAAALGTFSYTGQPASLLRGYEFVAAGGTFTYTGQDAGLRAAYLAPAAVGTFTYTGQNAGLFQGYDLAASVGTFTYSGQDASLLGSLGLPADAGSFSYNGQPATLSIGLSLAADAGIFTYNGQPATLSLAVGYSLPAAAGIFTYTGQDAGLLLGYDLAAAGGVFTYVGQDANLAATLRLAASVGIFSYAGQSARGTLNLDTFPPMSVVSGVRVSAGLFG